MKQTEDILKQRLKDEQEEPPNAPLESKDVKNNLRKSLRKRNYQKIKTSHKQSKESQLENILYFKCKKSISTWKVIIKNRFTFFKADLCPAVTTAFEIQMFTCICLF